MADESDTSQSEVGSDWMLTPEQRQRLEAENPESGFVVFFEKPYAEIKDVMAEHVRPGSRILDIGSSDGVLEDYLEATGEQYSVQCVDIDHAALDKLRQKQYKGIEISAVASDANQFLDGYEGAADQDVILINAALHEINDPAAQRQYLEHFLAKAATILSDSGQVIIGDYYYPDGPVEEGGVSDAEVAKFIEYQKKSINHADARNKFVKPQLIQEVAHDCGFEIETVRDIRAVEQINRRFYVVVLKKKTQEE